MTNFLLFWIALAMWMIFSKMSSLSNDDSKIKEFRDKLLETEKKLAEQRKIAIDLGWKREHDSNY